MQPSWSPNASVVAFSCNAAGVVVGLRGKIPSVPSSALDSFETPLDGWVVAY